MTVSELKRSTDRRFDRIDRRFNRMDRALEALRTELRGEIQKTRRYVDTTAGNLRRSLRDEIARSAEETRRHFDVVGEAIRADIRLMAEAVTSHGDRLDNHEIRITGLERRSN